jgi:hypothetical protein
LTEHKLGVSPPESLTYSDVGLTHAPTTSPLVVLSRTSESQDHVISTLLG